MNPTNPIIPEQNPTVSAYVTAGSLPAWEQVPQSCQQELILALAAIVIHLPELQPLLKMESSDEPE